jgi:hypothetical protein
VLYNTQSSSRLSSIDHENLFAHNYATSSLRQNEVDVMMSNNSNEFNSKHAKHRVLLNILIIEGFLIFNHPVTLDFCNVKFHLHVQYEIVKARRVNRVYNPPDPLGKNHFFSAQYITVLMLFIFFSLCLSIFHRVLRNGRLA